MKKTAAILILVMALGMGHVWAQSPDSLIVTNDNQPPGGMATVPILLKNVQFPVGGFSARLILADSTIASFIEVLRGEDVAQFEHFSTHITAGTCRFVGVANVPGGGDPAPLPMGVNEIAKIHIMVDDEAPWGVVDSIFFADDDLPPERDNSISDSTGYVNEIPSTRPGWIITDIIIGTDDSPAGLPSRINLFQNYPNPFNMDTRISFELPSNSNYVSLKIYDLVGRLTRAYEWSGLGAGVHDVVWDGGDVEGKTVSSGIYFYRLEVDANPVETMKMTLLK